MTQAYRNRPADGLRNVGLIGQGALRSVRRLFGQQHREFTTLAFFAGHRQTTAQDAGDDVMGDVRFFL
ncbi:MAG: hypothetical protein KDJ22_04455 [Candidatus Competibacteraceae bacterium]|nr:hypothetical protein [Candidatus Competibacteraceae bacterium]MCP5126970.1 hypothetical protein [Gammaproteobacteria bacterium]HRX70474.1 hypothetical protein [Candidatus Competibacteraceae bacterium]